jgi:trans-aconitate 2-methyltransferase
MSDVELSAAELLAAWDAQQTAFIEFRDQRTRCVVEILAARAAELDRPLRFVDLGCGPGSLTNAVLDRLPEAEATGVDRDPVLLRLFAESTPHAQRVQLVDVDLRDLGWIEALPHSKYDAAISATALHWLTPSELAQVYQGLGRVITPGGVILNADHLLFDDLTQPGIAQLSQQFRANAEARLRQAGALGWDEWWGLALSMPGWEAEATEYHRRWQESREIVKVDAEFHLAAMRAAGFAETTQVWQWLDDRIVYGRLPDRVSP